MNKYKLKMKTLTGLGNEYVYVYATSNFERYLNIHNLKYARDITKDYQLTDRFENLQSQLKAKEESIKEAREYIKEHIRIDDEYPDYMEMLITERDELDEILSKGENK